MSNIKDKQSQTLVKVVKTDIHQEYTIARGGKVQHELTSTLICVEVTGPLKGDWGSRDGSGQELCRISENLQKIGNIGRGWSM